MSTDWLKESLALREASEAYALATVVRCERPTSAKPGDKAIIHADGSLTGWIGGSCAQPLVIQEAQRSLADGQPRLLHLSPKLMADWAEREGLVSAEMTCYSGGTLEIFIEPVLPRPHLVLVGVSPVVEALARLGQAMEYQVTVVGPEATPARFPTADTVIAGVDLGQARLTPASFVVVASHGYYDEDTLQQALTRDLPYVALVASHKRALSVVEYLRHVGVAEDRLARLKYPAGLDLGGVAPAEIAVSILAEMVKIQRQGGTPLASGPALTVEPLDQPSLPPLPAPRPRWLAGETLALEPIVAPPSEPSPVSGTAIDPICGMAVDIATTRYSSRRGDETFYFCCPHCMLQFERRLVVRQIDDM